LLSRRQVCTRVCCCCAKVRAFAVTNTQVQRVRQGRVDRLLYDASSLRTRAPLPCKKVRASWSQPTDTQVLQRMHVRGGMSGCCSRRPAYARTHRCCWVKVPGERPPTLRSPARACSGGLLSCARRPAYARIARCCCAGSLTIDAAIDTQVLQRACRGEG
jgi:hypothetical protein